MKILCICGSPRKNGNSTKITETVCSSALKNGHSCKFLHVYDMKFSGCTGCNSCGNSNVKYCIHEDDFSKAVPLIIEADLLIFSSPVYFGQITGPLKTFLDRFCTFFDHNFQIRLICGKSFFTVLTCGAPAESFKSVEDYLRHWLGDFFHMNHKGSILEGNLSDPDDWINGSIPEKAKLCGEGL